MVVVVVVVVDPREIQEGGKAGMWHKISKSLEMGTEQAILITILIYLPALSPPPGALGSTAVTGSRVTGDV